MTFKEQKLAAFLLNMAADDFSNNGCNDLPKEAWEGWTEDERKNLIAEFYLSNGEKQEAEEGHVDIDDWVLMGFLADKLSGNKS